MRRRAGSARESGRTPPGEAAGDPTRSAGLRGPARDGDRLPASERILSRYLREAGAPPLLTAAEERTLGNTVARETRAIKTALAAIPCTAELALERWRALRREGAASGALSALPATLGPERSARLDAAMERVARHAAARAGARGADAEAAAARLARALLRADLALPFYEEAYQLLSARRRELDDAPSRGRRDAIRREVGLGARGLRRALERVERARSARQAALNAFVRHNQRLVVHQTKRFRGMGLPFLDLIQEANLGLIRAAEKYDPARGKFSTYAVWWIRQAAIRAIQGQARSVRLPSHTIDKLQRSGRAAATLAQRLGRAPGADELADALGTGPDEVERLRRAGQPAQSLDQPGRDGAAPALSETLADTNARDPDDEADRARRERALGAALATLSTREARVIRERFGLGGREPRPLHNLGEELGLSRERTRQIERRALDKLRRVVARGA